jgi:hypothetical protein
MPYPEKFTEEIEGLPAVTTSVWTLRAGFAPLPPTLAQIG